VRRALWFRQPAAAKNFAQRTGKSAQTILSNTFFKGFMVIMLILRVFGMRYPTLVSVKRKMATLTMGVKMRVNRWNTNSQRENGPKCYEHMDAVEFRRSYHQTLNTSRNLPAECCTSIHHGWRYRCKHHTTLPLHRKRYTTIFLPPICKQPQLPVGSPGSPPKVQRQTTIIAEGRGYKRL